MRDLDRRNVQTHDYSIWVEKNEIEEDSDLQKEKYYENEEYRRGVGVLLSIQNTLND